MIPAHDNRQHSVIECAGDRFVDFSTPGRHFRKVAVPILGCIRRIAGSIHIPQIVNRNVDPPQHSLNSGHP